MLDTGCVPLRNDSGHGGSGMISSFGQSYRGKFATEADQIMHIAPLDTLSDCGVERSSFAELVRRAREG